MTEPQIVRIASSGDARGHSVGVPIDALPSLSSIQNLHITTIVPNAVRGNHYHMHQEEVLVILSSSPWELHWDLPGEPHVRKRSVPAPGGYVVQIPRGVPHAVVNTGERELIVVAISEVQFNSENPDLHHYPLI